MNCLNKTFKFGGPTGFFMADRPEYSFSEYLDLDKKDAVFVRVVFSQDLAKIEAFAVSLIISVSESPVELARFDCSLRERLNVHRFYLKPPVKQYLDKETNFESLDYCLQNIKRNWAEYLLSYKLNYNK